MLIVIVLRHCCNSPDYLTKGETTGGAPVSLLLKYVESLGLEGHIPASAVDRGKKLMVSPGICVVKQRTMEKVIFVF